MKQKFFMLLMVSLTICLSAQQIKILNIDKPTVSFRGLAPVDNSVVWVSGDKGTVGLTYNGFKSVKWINPPGYETRDFRAIAAIDYQTAVVVAVGAPGIILKTDNGGNTWKEVYFDENPNVFLDDIDFAEYNPNLGMVVGDPINHQPYVLKTVDGGDTWTRIDPADLPVFAREEAFFAASNSNLKLLDETTFLGVTGGAYAHLMYNTKPAVKIPLPKTDSKTSGGYGLDYFPLENFGLIVGGDYKQPSSSENNLFIFELKDMRTPIISTPEVAPIGYKSGVAIQNGSKAISCGLSGVDLTTDKGKNWKSLTKTAYNSCKKAKNGIKIFLVGDGGRIGHLVD